MRAIGEALVRPLKNPNEYNYVTTDAAGKVVGYYLTSREARVHASRIQGFWRPEKPPELRAQMEARGTLKNRHTAAAKAGADTPSMRAWAAVLMMREARQHAQHTTPRKPLPAFVEIPPVVVPRDAGAPVVDTQGAAEALQQVQDAVDAAEGDLNCIIRDAADLHPKAQHIVWERVGNDWLPTDDVFQGAAVPSELLLDPLKAVVRQGGDPNEVTYETPSPLQATHDVPATLEVSFEKAATGGLVSVDDLWIQVVNSHLVNLVAGDGRVIASGPTVKAAKEAAVAGGKAKPPKLAKVLPFEPTTEVCDVCHGKDGYPAVCDRCGDLGYTNTCPTCAGVGFNNEGEPCSEGCAGGVVPASEFQTCKTCGGTDADCATCLGVGQVPEGDECICLNAKCPGCLGAGVVQRRTHKPLQRAVLAEVRRLSPGATYGIADLGGDNAVVQDVVEGWQNLAHDIRTGKVRRKAGFLR